MSSMWLFIFALAIFSLAYAEEDYNYDELVSEEPIQVISHDIDSFISSIKPKFRFLYVKLYRNNLTEKRVSQFLG